jgi:hypothetical protein
MQLQLIGTGIAELIARMLTQCGVAGTSRERRNPMTQELILGVLLTGLVGFIWIMTLSIIDGDLPAADDKNLGASLGGVEREESGLKRRTMTA